MLLKSIQGKEFMSSIQKFPARTKYKHTHKLTKFENENYTWYSPPPRSVIVTKPWPGTRSTRNNSPWPHGRLQSREKHLGGIFSLRFFSLLLGCFQFWYWKIEVYIQYMFQNFFENQQPAVAFLINQIVRKQWLLNDLYTQMYIFNDI